MDFEGNELISSWLRFTCVLSSTLKNS
uniref:Uncharacterized protein n=1 Tax=Arundo donax TaxID=35708 RepID=A0A0A9EEX7_ARUDO